VDGVQDVDIDKQLGLNTAMTPMGRRVGMSKIAASKTTETAIPEQE
jgi:hypothetical protein